MMDFAVLPPEVNSGRMYTGAGAGPLVAAAAAWDGLASDLTSAARSYQSVISELTSGSWRGPTSAAMAGAAAPYVAWMNTTAGQAEQTASQARSAASAYEAAFSATVPPAVVAANRAMLATLVATNIVGQNTPAIAANEAQYAEMWAQDASAMYGYAGASAAATSLTSFTSAPQTTNQTGTSSQAAAASQAATTSTGASAQSTISSALQSLASGAATTDPITPIIDWLNGPLGTALNSFTGALTYPTALLYDASFIGTDVIYQVTPLMTASLSWGSASAAAGGAAEGAAGAGLASSGAGAGMSGGAGLASSEVSAGLGRAASVGDLSVPQAWGTAAPEIRLAAKSLPMASLEGAPVAGAASGGFYGGGMPAVGPIGSVVNAPRNGDPRSRARQRHNVVARIPGDSDVQTDASVASGRWENFDEFAPNTKVVRSDRDELNELRKASTALSKERDALKRSLREALHEGASS